MACANTNCKCRSWCEIKTDEIKDPSTCHDVRIISVWWADKVAGRRDPEPEEEVDE